MQLNKDARKENKAQAGRFVQQIGSTVYTVNLNFKEGSKETPKDKVLWLLTRELETLAQNRVYKNNANIQNKALQNPPAYVMISMPQADLLPERSSV